MQTFRACHLCTFNVAAIFFGVILRYGVLPYAMILCQRVREIEHAPVTPLVVSASEGFAKEATNFCKRLASLLADKWDWRNFGPAKILVWGAKIPGKFDPPDYYFQKILVRTWNNGPSTNTSV